MKTHSLVLLGSLLLPCMDALPAEHGMKLKVPDLTKGEAIPAKATHDWTLGATGARGWMFCNELTTTAARQIRVTKVEPKSPADGVLAVGDVILGAAGKEFTYDPRTEMGKALTEAEKDENGGSLSLIRWREGKTETVALKLPTLGTYSATAPFDCPKSARILEQGCKSIAARIAADKNRQDPIPRIPAKHRPHFAPKDRIPSAFRGRAARVCCDGEVKRRNGPSHIATKPAVCGKSIYAATTTS
jgi:Family of unknown function (DUF6288)